MMSHGGDVTNICVLGAGVIGLSTAVQLQDMLSPSTVSITLIADKFDVDTTSDGAAGIFRPTADLAGGLPRHLLRQWCEDSFAYYKSLAESPEASEAGVGIVSGYHYFINQPREKDPVYSEVIYDYRQCTENELHIFPHTDKAHYATNFLTVIVECRWFLPWLMKRFKNKGGRVEMKSIDSLEQLAGKYDIVMNCTGLGSSKLLNDKVMVPYRGQMFRVKAPWIKHSLYIDHDCWVIPGRETVTIGGTRQMGDDGLEVRPEDRDQIWARACKYVPSLQHAKVEWEWVGLRPVRSPIRLEKEFMKFGHIALPVIHNYGHGGNGVGLGWGTAKHACRLVLEHLASNRSQAKL